MQFLIECSIEILLEECSGKAKTFIQMVGTVALFIPPIREIALGVITVGDIVVWIMAAITLISGIEYFKSFGGVLKFKKDDTEEK